MSTDKKENVNSHDDNNKKKNTKRETVREKEAIDENGDMIEAINGKPEANLSSECENTYIIVVGDEQDQDINICYVNEDLIRNEMQYDVAGLELFGKPPSNSNLMCRLCMSADDNSGSKLLPLLNSNTKLKFINVSVTVVLESLTGLKVNQEDELPKYICKVCLSRLEICWAFRQQCLKSDKVMRELNQASKQFCEMSCNASASDADLNKSRQDTVSESDLNSAEELVDGITIKEGDDLEKIKHFLGRTCKSMPRILRKNSPAKTPPNKSNKRKASQLTKAKELQSQLERTDTKTNEYDLKRNSLICDVCDWNGNSVEELNDHRKSHAAEYPYNCQLCYKLFKTESVLSSHVKSAHKKKAVHKRDRRVKCRVCNVYVAKNLIADHYLVHKTEKIYVTRRGRTDGKRPCITKSLPIIQKKKKCIASKKHYKKGKERKSLLQPVIKGSLASVDNYRLSNLPPDSSRDQDMIDLSSVEGSVITELTDPVQSKHCPLLRPGSVRCSFCWTMTDSNGKITRRMTQYQCSDCNMSLCLVPCFEEYHEQIGSYQNETTTSGNETKVTNKNRRQSTINLIRNNARLSGSLKRHLLSVASKLLPDDDGVIDNTSNN